MSAHRQVEEAGTAVAMMIDNPEGSQQIYDKVREQLGLQKPAGGIFHVAGPSRTAAGG
jgi:hypothetical protein